MDTHRIAYETTDGGDRRCTICGRHVQHRGWASHASKHKRRDIEVARTVAMYAESDLGQYVRIDSLRLAAEHCLSERVERMDAGEWANALARDILRERLRRSTSPMIVEAREREIVADADEVLAAIERVTSLGDNSPP